MFKNLFLIRFKYWHFIRKYPKQQGLPETYKNLIQPLLSPLVWQFVGNIPGITRLLIAILEHDPNSTFINGGEKTLTPLLGVFQNLLASKINDGYGFDLIQSIMLNILYNHHYNHFTKYCSINVDKITKISYG